MAQLSDKEKLNLSLKMVFGVQGLNNADPETAGGLRWSEEEYAWNPFVVNEDLYMDPVPYASNMTEADNNASTSPYVEKVIKKLTLVPGVADRAWAAFNTYNDADSGIMGDWLLPQLFGRGYAARLFQASTSDPNTPGDEISTTEGAWIPSYKSGFIVLGKNYTAAMMGWTTPLFIQAYRYVGAKGVSGASAGVSLDDAYDNGTIINADSGPVNISASGGYPPLQISQITSVPTQSLDAGQIANINGLLYQYDLTRSVWKSVYEMIVPFSTREGSGNYLSTGGQHSDINSGYVALRGGIITGISANVGSRYNDPSVLDKTFHIRKNQSQTSEYSFTTSGTYFSASNLNLTFDAGDLIQVYIESGPKAFSPRVDLHINWRV